MPYAIAQDLQDRYPEQDLIQLTDRAGVAIDIARLERALADASAEIDAYLQGRYDLPLAQVPEILKLVCCDIAMYRLQVLRPLGDIEDARQRYKDARSYLTQVSKGEVQLGLSAADVPAEEAPGPITSGPERIFSRDSMKGF